MTKEDRRKKESKAGLTDKEARKTEWEERVKVGCRCVTISRKERRECWRYVIGKQTEGKEAN